MTLTDTQLLRTQSLTFDIKVCKRYLFPMCGLEPCYGVQSKLAVELGRMGARCLRSYDRDCEGIVFRNYAEIMEIDIKISRGLHLFHWKRIAWELA